MNGLDVQLDELVRQRFFGEDEDDARRDTRTRLRNGALSLQVFDVYSAKREDLVAAPFGLWSGLPVELYRKLFNELYPPGTPRAPTQQRCRANSGSGGNRRVPEAAQSTFATSSGRSVSTQSGCDRMHPH